MSIIYQSFSSFYPDIETIKVSTTDTTLTTSPANATVLNELASLISATTEPFIAGSPYVTSTGSAILFVVRADAFTQSALQTAVAALSGLSGATVAISSTLVG